jgi:hypothetical protein
VPNIIGKPWGDVKSGFELAAAYCLRFFEIHLQDKGKASDLLNITSANAKLIDKPYLKKGLRVPPNITLVKDGFTKEGIANFERVFMTLYKQDSVPFSLGFYSDLKNWLAWKKDPEFKSRYRLYELALKSFPDSATVNYYLAYFAMKTGRKSTSAKHFKKAMSLLETDRSPELTPDRKVELRKSITQYLKG